MGKAEKQLSKTALENRIRKHYDALPESERKVGDLIVDFPGQIAAYSATELAALAGASKAAVTRLSHRLGYDNFAAMRRAARAGRQAGSPLYLLSQDQDGQDFSALAARHHKQDGDLLSQSLDGLDPESFTACIAAICRAERVFVAGWRNSQYLAGYLRWQLIQVRDDVHLLPRAGETLGESLADLNSDDMVILFGFRRRVATLPATLKLVLGSGARILYFTDQEPGTDGPATWTVRCPIRSADALDRYAGVMSLLHFHAMAVLREMGAKGRARLARIEQAHEALHEFA
ncbi:MAG: MurR/RpiR family transcriptional regulator [Alphaproteobacteria bacterium]